MNPVNGFLAEMLEGTGVGCSPGSWSPAQRDGRLLIIDGSGGLPAQGNREIYKLAGAGEENDFSLPIEALPFEAGQFAAAICLQAAGCMVITVDFLREISRVTAPGGRIVILDSLVPGSRLRGKKARKEQEAGAYVNAWLRLRSPQHQQLLSQDGWVERLRAAGLVVEEMETREVEHDFDRWAARGAPTERNTTRLRAMLIQAPENVRCFLTPSRSGARIAFRLTDVFIAATTA